MPLDSCTKKAKENKKPSQSLIKRRKAHRREMPKPIRHDYHQIRENHKLKKSTVLISILLLLPALLLFRTHATPSPGSEAGRRRLLWTVTLQKSYITYDVLKRDKVPCDRPGSPYYSCHENGDSKANPYVRGCSIITGCREGSP
ncbi:Protein RALF-like 24 [Platanthera zijinensis]|uniref:Protein RALF-like 24 n=1 Tax=Platanthera zijinensis TaxID=2320716 RepID=A0AAP0G1Q6_9ASPA